MEHKIVARYLTARKLFLEESVAYPSLQGNDNIIGRIGEYIAMEFLKSEAPKKASASNQCGWDLELKNGNKVSVRMITSENKNGTTTPIRIRRKDGMITEWDELLLILLQDNKVTQIGRISRKHFIKAFQLDDSERPVITNRKFLAPSHFSYKWWKIEKPKGFDFNV